MGVALIASGGGHTGYAIAIAEELVNVLSGEPIVFIVPRNDYWSISRIIKRIGRVGKKYIVVEHVVKPRKPLEPWRIFIVRSPRALYDSFRVFERVRELVSIVICTGSNHSLYPSIVSKLFYGKKVFCIEAVDRIITSSKTVKILYEFLGIPIFIHWSEQKRNYPRGLVTGPVYEKPLYKPRDEGYILVTTGTMGNKKLFDLLLNTSLENVVVQTGRINPEYILKHKPGWKVFRFDPDIDKWIAGATLVISHQGLTVVEAALAYRKPVILAFNPDLPSTSKYIDAWFLAKKLNSTLINPTEITSGKLEEIISEYVGKMPPQYYNGAKIIAKIIKDNL